MSRCRTAYVTDRGHEVGRQKDASSGPCGKGHKGNGGRKGHFGGRSARVVWVGCADSNGRLQKLQTDIEQQLALAGWPEEERDFTGHLTLCRVRNPKAGVKLAQLTETYKDFKLGTMPADSVVVYQSELRPSGPVYTALGNYELK